MRKILQKNLGIVIPHGSALRLLTDSFPIKKLQRQFNIIIICDKELIIQYSKDY